MPVDDKGSLFFQQLSQRGLVLGWLRRALVGNESRGRDRANSFAGHLANRLASAEGLFFGFSPHTESSRLNLACLRIFAHPPGKNAIITLVS